VLGRAAQRLCVPLEARLHHLIPNFDALFGKERASISGKAFIVLQSSSCTKFGGDPIILTKGTYLCSQQRKGLTCGSLKISTSSLEGGRPHCGIGPDCHFPQISGISSSINELDTHPYSSYIWPSIPHIFGLNVLITINIRVSHQVFPIHWIGHLLHSACIIIYVPSSRSISFG
jgi:hypothetical protein